MLQKGHGHVPTHMHHAHTRHYPAKCCACALARRRLLLPLCALLASAAARPLDVADVSAEADVSSDVDVSELYGIIDPGLGALAARLAADEREGEHEDTNHVSEQAAKCVINSGGDDGDASKGQLAQFSLTSLHPAAGGPALYTPSLVSPLVVATASARRRQVHRELRRQQVAHERQRRLVLGGQCLGSMRRLCRRFHPRLRRHAAPQYVRLPVETRH